MVKARDKERCTLTSGGMSKQQEDKRRRTVMMFPGRRGG
jgi:hypothetical protein